MWDGQVQCGQSQPLAGGPNCIFKKIVISKLRKPLRSKPVSSISPTLLLQFLHLGSFLGFLPWLPWPMDSKPVSQIIPFLPHVAFGQNVLSQPREASKDSSSQGSYTPSSLVKAPTRAAPEWSASWLAALTVYSFCLWKLGILFLTLNLFLCYYIWSITFRHLEGLLVMWLGAKEAVLYQISQRASETPASVLPSPYS